MLTLKDLKKWKIIFFRILDGTNCTFIGFGQTGAGKSTTMHGLNSVFNVNT